MKRVLSLILAALIITANLPAVFAEEIVDIPVITNEAAVEKSGKINLGGLRSLKKNEEKAETEYNMLSSADDELYINPEEISQEISLMSVSDEGISVTVKLPEGILAKDGDTMQVYLGTPATLSGNKVVDEGDEWMYARTVSLTEGQTEASVSFSVDDGEYTVAATGNISGVSSQKVYYTHSGNTANFYLADSLEINGGVCNEKAELTLREAETTVDISLDISDCIPDEITDVSVYAYNRDENILARFNTYKTVNAGDENVNLSLGLDKGTYYFYVTSDKFKNGYYDGNGNVSDVWKDRAYIDISDDTEISMKLSARGTTVVSSYDYYNINFDLGRACDVDKEYAFKIADTTDNAWDYSYYDTVIIPAGETKAKVRLRMKSDVEAAYISYREISAMDGYYEESDLEMFYSEEYIMTPVAGNASNIKGIFDINIDLSDFAIISGTVNATGARDDNLYKIVAAEFENEIYYDIAKVFGGEFCIKVPKKLINKSYRIFTAKERYGSLPEEDERVYNKESYTLSSETAGITADGGSYKTVSGYISVPSAADVDGINFEIFCDSNSYSEFGTYVMKQNESSLKYSEIMASDTPSWGVMAAYAYTYSAHTMVPRAYSENMENCNIDFAEAVILSGTVSLPKGYTYSENISMSISAYASEREFYAEVVIPAGESSAEYSMKIAKNSVVESISYSLWNHEDLFRTGYYTDDGMVSGSYKQVNITADSDLTADFTLLYKTHITGNITMPADGYFNGGQVEFSVRAEAEDGSFANSYEITDPFGDNPFEIEIPLDAEKYIIGLYVYNSGDSSIIEGQNYYVSDGVMTSDKAEAIAVGAGSICNLLFPVGKVISGKIRFAENVTLTSGSLMAEIYAVSLETEETYFKYIENITELGEYEYTLTVPDGTYVVSAYLYSRDDTETDAMLYKRYYYTKSGSVTTDEKEATAVIPEAGNIDITIPRANILPVTVEFGETCYFSGGSLQVSISAESRENGIFYKNVELTDTSAQTIDIKVAEDIDETYKVSVFVSSENALTTNICRGTDFYYSENGTTKNDMEATSIKANGEAVSVVIPKSPTISGKIILPEGGKFETLPKEIGLSLEQVDGDRYEWLSAALDENLCYEVSLPQDISGEYKVAMHFNSDIVSNMVNQNYYYKDTLNFDVAEDIVNINFTPEVGYVLSGDIVLPEDCNAINPTGDGYISVETHTNSAGTASGKNFNFEFSIRDFINGKIPFSIVVPKDTQNARLSAYIFVYSNPDEENRELPSNIIRKELYYVSDTATSIFAEKAAAIPVSGDKQGIKFMLQTAKNLNINIVKPTDVSSVYGNVWLEDSESGNIHFSKQYFSIYSDSEEENVAIQIPNELINKSYYLKYKLNSYSAYYETEVFVKPDGTLTIKQEEANAFCPNEYNKISFTLATSDEFSKTVKGTVGFDKPEAMRGAYLYVYAKNADTYEELNKYYNFSEAVNNGFKLAVPNEWENIKVWIEVYNYNEDSAVKSGNFYYTGNGFTQNYNDMQTVSVESAGNLHLQVESLKRISGKINIPEDYRELRPLTHAELAFETTDGSIRPLTVKLNENYNYSAYIPGDISGACNIAVFFDDHYTSNNLIKEEYFYYTNANGVNEILNIDGKTDFENINITPETGYAVTGSIKLPNDANVPATSGDWTLSLNAVSTNGDTRTFNTYATMEYGSRIAQFMFGIPKDCEGKYKLYARASNAFGNVYTGDSYYRSNNSSTIDIKKADIIDITGDVSGIEFLTQIGYNVNITFDKTEIYTSGDIYLTTKAENKIRSQYMYLNPSSERTVVFTLPAEIVNTEYSLYYRLNDKDDDTVYYRCNVYVGNDGLLSSAASAAKPFTLSGNTNIYISPAKISDIYSPEYVMESAHPYANNASEEYTYTHNETVDFLRLKFSPETKLEYNDYIRLYDAEGNLAGEYGYYEELAGKTVSVPGSAVKLVLETNGYTTDYGFAVESITGHSYVLESEHPYKAGVYEYRHTTEADALDITFSQDTYLESGDYLAIEGGDGTRTYYGTNLAGKTVRVKGNYFKITISARDAAESGYGFSIEDIKEIKLNTVTYKNYDGTIIGTEDVEDGKAANYSYSPQKPADEKYIYEFTGWDVSLDCVTEDITATAQFAAREYRTVTFKNYDGTVLYEAKTVIGRTAVYSGNIPEKPAEGDINYIFSGWDKPIKNITENITVTAQFNAVKILMQSEHPYAANMDKYFEYTHPTQENKLYITFIDGTETEQNYDFIYIYDGGGNEVGCYTGTQLSGRTVEIPGYSFKIRLTSDGGVQRYGFAITEITGCQHTYGEWITGKVPTCQEAGEKYRECIECGNRETGVIPVTSHIESDEWIVDSEPDCTDAGNKHKICISCGNTVKTEIIPATGHSGKWTVIREYATCTEDASKERVCDVCGVTETVITEYAFGHSYGDWVVESAPTYTERGVNVKTCGGCGDTEYSYTDKLKDDYSEDINECKTTIKAGGSITALLEYSSDTDLFMFVPEKTDFYTFSAESESGLDISICSADRSKVSTDKESFGYVAELNGETVYYVSVSADRDSWKDTSYTLYAAVTEDDCENYIETAKQIKPGEISGILEYKRDTDMFRYTAEKTGDYKISINTEEAEVKVYNSYMELLGLNMTMTGGETYYIEVKGKAYGRPINYILNFRAKMPVTAVKNIVKDCSYDAIAFSWDYDGNTEDFERFRIYRSNSKNGKFELIGSTKNNKFTDRTERGRYYYKIETLDIFGTGVFADIFEAATFENDTKKPEGTMYWQNFASAGYPSVFKASDLKDDDAVAEVEWDFGDGNTAKGEFVSHTYAQAGGYNVKMTVSDHAGNTAVFENTVTVIGNGTDSGYRTAEITVNNAMNGTMAAGAEINLASDDGDLAEPVFGVTDSEGKIYLPVKTNRGYEMSAFSEDVVGSAYMFANPYSEAELKENVAAMQIVDFTIKRKRSLSGGITSRELSYDEIKELGIDMNDPANHHITEFKIVLEYEQLPIVVFRRNGSGIILGDDCVTIDGNGKPTYKIHYGGSYGKTSYFFVIRGEVSWLKQMFDVTLLVHNDSETDWVENAKATLKLPEGLSLAGMVDRKQTLNSYIGKIEPLEDKTVTWYVRGDIAGEYNLEATVMGDFMPAPIEQFEITFKTKEPLVVADQSDAIEMNLYNVPKKIVGGGEISFDIEVKNVSERDLNHLTLKLTNIEQFSMREGSTGKIVYSNENINQGCTIDVLKPGESLIYKFTGKVNFPSCSNAVVEYELKNWFIETEFKMNVYFSDEGKTKIRFDEEVHFAKVDEATYLTGTFTSDTCHFEDITFKSSDEKIVHIDMINKIVEKEGTDGKIYGSFILKLIGQDAGPTSVTAKSTDGAGAECAVKSRKKLEVVDRWGDRLNSTVVDIWENDLEMNIEFEKEIELLNASGIILKDKNGRELRRMKAASENDLNESNKTNVEGTLLTISPKNSEDENVKLNIKAIPDDEEIYITIDKNAIKPLDEYYYFEGIDDKVLTFKTTYGMSRFKETPYFGNNYDAFFTEKEKEKEYRYYMSLQVTDLYTSQYMLSMDPASLGALGNQIADKFFRKWTGSCEGISVVGAFMKKGYDYFSMFGKNYYNFPAPKDSTEAYGVRDYLNYFTLLQRIPSYVSATPKSKNKNIGDFKQEVKKIVEKAKQCKANNDAFILKIKYSDGDKESAHAVLCCNYFEEQKSLVIMDPNTPNKRALIKVSDDFSKVTYQNSKDVHEICCVDVEEYAKYLEPFGGTSAVSLAENTVGNILEDHTFLYVTANGDYTITNSEGEILTCVNGTSGGDMEIVSERFITSDAGFACTVIYQVKNSDKFTLKSNMQETQMQILSNDMYADINAKNANTVTVETGKALRLSGTDMTYTVGISTDNDDYKLMTLSGKDAKYVNMTYTDSLSEVGIYSDNLKDTEVGLYNEDGEVLTEVIETDADKMIISENTDSISDSAAYTAGDVNADTSVNAADATLMLRDYVGLDKLGTKEKFISDMNNDGVINAIDATLALRKYIGLKD